MAKKQYLDYAGLTTYDEQIKSYIDAGDEATSSKLTSGTITVKEAQHAASADNATKADSATTADSATKATQDGDGKNIASTYETKTDASAKLTEAKTYTDTEVAKKADANHNHDSKYDEKGAAATAESNAKAYADSAAAKVKSDLVNGAGTAYDTLLELGNLIDDNKDAIDALEEIASGKANATHSHAISDVTGLQSALDGKAAQTSLDSHTGNTTVHITADERTKWNAAKTHADSAHAPSNAQANVIETINVNGTTLTPTSKAVNITVPTDYLTATDIANKADKSTTLAGYGITNAYTKTEVDDKLSAKAAQTALDSVSSVANEAKSTAATNTSAISSNTSAISALTTRTAALEALDTHESIPTASITALFSA